MFNVTKWLDGLDLEFKVVNMQKDLANGLAVAEILSYYHPQLIGPEYLENGLAMDKRIANWDFITQKLKKIDFPFPTNYKQLRDDIICQKLTNSGEEFIIVLYEFLTGRTVEREVVKKDEAPPKKQEPAQPARSNSCIKSQGEESLLLQKQEQQYNESFTRQSPTILEIFHNAYKETFNQLQRMTMYDIFIELSKVEDGLGEVDEDLQAHKPIMVYPEQIVQNNIYKFFETALSLSNIELGSQDELTCRIFFHMKFISNLEVNLQTIIQTCSTGLENQVPAFLQMLNIYYNSTCDIIYMKQKDLTHIFMDQLLHELKVNNNKNSQYLQILIHSILVQLPQDFLYISEQFINTNVLLSRQMLTHVLNDNFYSEDIRFFRQRLNSENNVRYQAKSKQSLSQTSFISSILSKILIRHPKVVLTMINSYIMQYMKISNIHTLNPAAKEYTDKMTSMENDSEDYDITIIEYQSVCKQMSRTQLLFIMLLAEQFTYTFEYCKDVSQCDTLEIAKYFMFYAVELENLKSDNISIHPLITSYLDKRKGLSIMYLNILEEIYLLLYLDVEKVATDDTLDAPEMKSYIEDFVRREDSKLTLVYKGVQLITQYITGVQSKVIREKNLDLQDILNKFCQSERSDNIQSILSATSRMCDSLYQIIAHIVGVIMRIYEEEIPAEEIEKYLVSMPQVITQTVEPTFLRGYELIQQLTSVCRELLTIVEEVNDVCCGTRKADGYHLIDMDLEEEPPWPCMNELHRALKRLF